MIKEQGNVDAVVVERANNVSPVLLLHPPSPVQVRAQLLGFGRRLLGKARIICTKFHTLPYASVQYYGCINRYRTVPSSGSKAKPALVGTKSWPADLQSPRFGPHTGMQSTLQGLQLAVY